MNSQLPPIARSFFEQACRCQHEVEDRCETSYSIHQLPEDLRQVAYLLAEGWKDGQIAAVLGKTRDQIVYRRALLKKAFLP